MIHEEYKIHGGNLYNASKFYGVDSEQILDYSANINPLGVPQFFKDTIVSSMNSLVNYPDPDCTNLKAAVSEYLDIPLERMVIGNGASEILFLVFEALRPESILIPAPTFSEYSNAANRYGCNITYFRLYEESGFNLLFDNTLYSTVQNANAIILCNPNNPTSTLIKKDDLFELAEYLNKKDKYLIIDESFIELTEGGNKNSLKEGLLKYNNLFIIRAFTKIFAIPGLRLGYGLGNETLVRKIAGLKIPWSVNSFSCNAGILLSQGADYLKKTVAWLAEEKVWFFNQLSQISGLKFFQPQANFILIKILDENLTSSKLRIRMAAKGILIRDAENFMFLDNKYIRIAIKDRTSNLIFLKELDQVLMEASRDGS